MENLTTSPINFQERERRHDPSAQAESPPVPPLPRCTEEFTNKPRQNIPVLVSAKDGLTSVNRAKPKSITKAFPQTLRTINLFGPDTVHLWAPSTELRFTPDLSISDKGGRNPLTGKLDFEYPLLTLTNGRVVKGEFFKRNTSNFQFSVSWNKETGCSTCYLQFSAAAFAPDNLSLLDEEGLIQAVGKVQAALKEHGIYWELMTARIGGLALTKNLLLSEPPSNFLALLAGLQFKRAARKMGYGSGAQGLGNKQWYSVFYNKELEMKEKGKDFQQCPRNLTRAEMTFKNSETTFKAVQAKTIPKLLERWDSLKPAYHVAMKREIFKPVNDAAAEERPACCDWVALLDDASQSQRPFSTFTASAGALAFVQDQGLERAKWLIQNQLCDSSTKTGRGQRDRWFSALEAAAVILEMQKTANNGRARRELYAELRAAVLDA
jgi:hypothetical protein